MWCRSVQKCSKETVALTVAQDCLLKMNLPQVKLLILNRSSVAEVPMLLTELVT